MGNETSLTNERRLGLRSHSSSRGALIQRHWTQSPSLHSQKLPPIAKRHNPNEHVPFLQLPEEIISEISLLAMLPLDMFVWRSPVLAISSSWRACVINTTRVWSCIHIVGGRYETERLREWFHRCGNGCPLYLTVKDIQMFKAVETSWINEGSSLPRRISTLVIKSTQYGSPHPFPLRFDASNLRKLDARFYLARDDDDDSRNPISIFEKFTPTRLQILKLDTLLTVIGAFRTTFDVSSLTFLDLGVAIAFGDVIELLKRTSRLECLRWSLFNYPLDVASELSRLGGCSLELYCLQHLVLVGYELSMGVLCMIEAPSLRQLRFSGTSDDGSDFHYLIEFVSECPQLTHLDISDVDDYVPSAENVNSLLYAAPKLEWFEVNWCDSNFPGILALCGELAQPTADDQASWACPTMRLLHLPLNRYVASGQLSKEAAARSLEKLLDGRGNTAHTPTQRQLPPSVELGLQLVVDVDVAIVERMLGPKWIQEGGRTMSPLIFPSWIA